MAAGGEAVVAGDKAGERPTDAEASSACAPEGVRECGVCGMEGVYADGAYRCCLALRTHVPHSKNVIAGTITMTPRVDSAHMPKKLTRQSRIGQQGVSILEAFCLNAPLIWRPITIHDLGVDGQIELEDPETGFALNKIISCQVKSSIRPIAFNQRGVVPFYVSVDDFQYWCESNIPCVLLYIDCTNENIYWRHITPDSGRKTSESAVAVEFHRSRDLLTHETVERLSKLATPNTHGVVIQPKPRAEELTSNLVPIGLTNDRMYVSAATVNSAAEAISTLRSHNIAPWETPFWVMNSDFIISLDRPEHNGLRYICDEHSTEPIEVSHWRDSDDQDITNVYRTILNQAMRKQLAEEMFFDKGSEGMYFKLPRGGRERRIRYQSVASRSTITVVQPIQRDSGQPIYRHLGFTYGLFHLDSEWFISISPEYLFTKDGFDKYSWSSEWVSGIKRVETNRNVLSQILLISQFLSEETPLLKQRKILKFGSLLPVTSPVAIQVGTEPRQSDEIEDDGGDSDQLTLDF